MPESKYARRPEFGLASCLLMHPATMRRSTWFPIMSLLSGLAGACSTEVGAESLPLCVAKTQMSLSDDPARAGRPEGFEITVRRFVLAAGAGFVVAILGEILRMPGLPAHPQAAHIDLVDGEVRGMH